jgi:hypothetical protein
VEPLWPELVALTASRQLAGREVPFEERWLRRMLADGISAVEFNKAN